jgi:hypothetical protein
MSKVLKNAIVVEGKNDQAIIKMLMQRYFGLSFIQTQAPRPEWYCQEKEISIMEAGGIDKTEDRVKRLVHGMGGEKRIEKIFIITDADKSKKSAEDFVKDIADKRKDTGVQFAHHIITRPSKDYGIMEDLFLDIVVNLTDDFYQKDTIMQLVSDVRNDVDKDAAKDHYSRKVKAATTSFVRFYNCKTDVDKNDICSLMENEGIASKIMEYDTVKEMLRKIGEHFNLEPASN